MPAASALAFDLCNEDAFVFDQSPDLFVHLDVTPVVFTVRGLAYFAPRFKFAGLDLAAIHSPDDFAAAYATWCRVEWNLLQDKVQAAAGATHAANAHQVLQAILHGDVNAAEHAVARLEHRARAGLQVVSGDSK